MSADLDTVQAMTLQFNDHVTDLTSKCQELFGDESKWVTAAGYRDGLALGIIDAIYSTGSHYQSVINVVHAYCEYRRSQGATPHTDGPAELLATFEELGGSDAWASQMKNRKPASTAQSAVPKAEVVRQAASVLNEMGITKPSDLREWTASEEALAPLKSAWRALPSQSSAITLNYLVILAGLQSVKADRMIMRFIYGHTGLTADQITSSEAVGLIKQVAANYPTEARKLDHVIWRYESGREFLLPGSEN